MICVVLLTSRMEFGLDAYVTLRFSKLCHNLQGHLRGQVFLHRSASLNYCDSTHGESAISTGGCFWLSLVHNRDCYIACISTGWCGAYHMTSCTCSTSWTTAALSTRFILPATLSYVRVGLPKVQAAVRYGNASLVC
jgi:hypothetical protein